METRPRSAALVSESQVEAAISLLTDSSDRVVEGCRRALLAHATLAESLLRERLLSASGAEADTLRAALLDVVGSRLEAPLMDHIVHGPSLEQGSILIGRLIDATESPIGVSAALDAMAAQVSAELEARRAAGTLADAGPDGELAVLTEVLVRGHALTGTDTRHADARDAVLHGVISRHRGLPLALCMTWLLVARRVGLPLHGVNMPGHFLLRWERPGQVLVLDPFHGGRILKDGECRRMLVDAGYPSIDVTLLHATDRDMLLRTLRNLMMIASRLRERELAARCARIISRTTAIIGA
jgi:regulator of sirC expression with transglutaminase-like and TPR domain